MNNFFKTILVVLLGLSLVACGGSDSGGTTTPVGGDDKVTENTTAPEQDVAPADRALTHYKGLAGVGVVAGVEFSGDLAPLAMEQQIQALFDNGTCTAGGIINGGSQYSNDVSKSSFIGYTYNGGIASSYYDGRTGQGISYGSVIKAIIGDCKYLFDDVTGLEASSPASATHSIYRVAAFPTDVNTADNLQDLIKQAVIVVEVLEISSGSTTTVEYLTETYDQKTTTIDYDGDGTANTVLTQNGRIYANDVSGTQTINGDVTNISNNIELEYVDLDNPGAKSALDFNLIDPQSTSLDIDWLVNNGLYAEAANLKQDTPENQLHRILMIGCSVGNIISYTAADFTSSDANKFEIKHNSFSLTLNGVVHNFKYFKTYGALSGDNMDNVKVEGIIEVNGSDPTVTGGGLLKGSCGDIKYTSPNP